MLIITVGFIYTSFLPPGGQKYFSGHLADPLRVSPENDDQESENSNLEINTEKAQIHV